jgi:transposase InsO family protein
MVQYLCTTLVLEYMDMAYTNNPKLPQVRMEAVSLLQEGWSTRKVARYTGYSHSTIVRWSHKKPCYGRYGRLVIPTESSRPLSHPKQLSEEIVSLVLKIRSERNQCAEIIHHKLKKQGVVISLSSIKRILKRSGCTKYSKWKKWHQYPVRPLPEKPGILVELDSVIEGTVNDRLCAFALIDVCSRWAFVEPVRRATSRASVRFVNRAKEIAPFSLQCIQTDHGSEFSKWFTKVIEYRGIKHRHSRLRRPTDNGHVERFIRTLQDECLHCIPRSYSLWKKEIPVFIRYYNNERPHMGINMRTPLEVVRSY